MEASWGDLGGSWDELGSSCGPLVVILGPIGAVLGSSWDLLGRSGDLLGQSWDPWGRSWHAVGRYGGPLDGMIVETLIFHWFYKVLAGQVPWHNRQRRAGPEPRRGQGGAFWDELGSSCGHLGAYWGSLGVVLGPLGAVWGPLGTVLGPLGTILARCWPVWWPLGRHDSGNVDFSLVLQGFGRPGTVAQPPKAGRAGTAEGVRGRHKSLPRGLGLGFVIRR